MTDKESAQILHALFDLKIAVDELPLKRFPPALISAHQEARLLLKRHKAHLEKMLSEQSEDPHERLGTGKALLSDADYAAPIPIRKS